MYKKYILLLFTCANIVLIIWFWYSSSGDLLSGDNVQLLLGLGRLMGLFAAFFVLFQVMCIARIPWMEKLLSFDRLTYLHHLNGLWLLISLILHPIFLGLSYASTNDISFWQQQYNFLFYGDELVGAFFGLFILVCVAVISISKIRRMMSYEMWYTVHLTVYIAIALAFGHEIELGGDFVGNNICQAYWYILYVGVFGNLLAYRFIKPVYMWNKHHFVVDHVESENDNVYSLYIRGKNLDSFKVQSGQFAIFRFLDKKRWWKAHPFSFSSAVVDGVLRVTFKDLGDFTHELGTVSSGTSIIIDGPHGNFVTARSTRDTVVCIAGGIGITPVRALIESFDKHKQVILVYSVKSKKDFVFKDEIEKITQERFLKIYYLVSDDTSWEGLKGRVDEQFLNMYIKNIDKADVYMCGPTAMMKGVRASLKKCGASNNHIFFEK